MVIIKTATEAQNKDIENALDYCLAVIEKQGRVIETRFLFGDGSRWPTLTRKAFDIIADSAIQATLEKSFNQ